MNVSLTRELEDLVEAKVSSGRYKSASEVVRDALRLLAERDELHAARVTEMRALISEGIAQADAGQLADGEESMARARARIDAKNKGR